jgi:hypothetical protein
LRKSEVGIKIKISGRVLSKYYNKILPFGFFPKHKK